MGITSQLKQIIDCRMIKLISHNWFVSRSDIYSRRKAAFRAVSDIGVCLLVRKAMSACRYVATFRRNINSPSSGPERGPNCLHYSLEDGGSIFLLNGCTYPRVYTAMQHRRPTLTLPPPWEPQVYAVTDLTNLVPRLQTFPLQIRVARSRHRIMLPAVHYFRFMMLLHLIFYWGN